MDTVCSLQYQAGVLLGKSIYFIFKLKLKLKPTPFGIVHHSKGLPFQVHLTVSTVLKVMYVYKKLVLMFLDEVVLKEKYLAISPIRTEGCGSPKCFFVEMCLQVTLKAKQGG